MDKYTTLDYDMVAIEARARALRAAALRDGVIALKAWVRSFFQPRAGVTARQA